MEIAGQIRQSKGRGSGEEAGRDSWKKLEVAGGS